MAAAIAAATIAAVAIAAVAGAGVTFFSILLSTYIRGSQGKARAQELHVGAR